MTAFRAASLRCSGVILAALAGPPFLPPLRPSATACGFFAMPSFIPDRSRKNKKIVIDIRERSRIIVREMNVLGQDRKLSVIGALVEGNSIRSIERMTGIHRDTIMRLTVRVGEACARLLDERIRNVKAQRVQVDEIWTFVFVKQARLNGQHNHAEMGDQYVFVGMDSDSKLVISHLVGKRDGQTAHYFMQDLEGRIVGRVRLT